MGPVAGRWRTHGLLVGRLPARLVLRRRIRGRPGSPPVPDSHGGIGRWNCDGPGCPPWLSCYRPRLLADDGALDAWIASHLGTAHHTCGTAPMGPADDPATVVDQYSRVHGVAGLRVADTSVLPDAPLRGPAATAVLLGELVAHAMRHDLP
ncbi:GMC oxidoreductase [Streptomyces sp. NPDC050508]|uniref:GMC oxidoreductase n=1 Tax=Streptomyces sp. NPDC050508 TaxID=3155405 RepID=UPI00343FF8A4